MPRRHALSLKGFGPVPLVEDSTKSLYQHLSCMGKEVQFSAEHTAHLAGDRAEPMGLEGQTGCLNVLSSYPESPGPVVAVNEIGTAKNLRLNLSSINASLFKHLHESCDRTVHVLEDVSAYCCAVRAGSAIGHDAVTDSSHILPGIIECYRDTGPEHCGYQ